MKLLILICFLFAGCTGHEYMSSRCTKDLNKLLSKETASGALLKQVMHEDAHLTLVHIRQEHYSDIYTRQLVLKISKANSSEITQLKHDYCQLLLRINRIQKEIALFIKLVTNSKDVIYVEGMAYPDIYSRKFLNSYIKRTVEEINGLLEAGGEMDFKLPQPPYYAGATFYLVKHNGSRVYGAEHRGLLDFTLSAYANNKLPGGLRGDLIKACHLERENQMLINISNGIEELTYRNPSIRFLVCGSRHDFKKHVKKWNNLNPTKKINLLTFSPKSLIDE